MASDFITGLYDRLPDGLQTLALNGFGLRNRWRYRRWTRILRSLEPSESWTEEQQVRHVAGRLRSVLRHAIERVPHYRRHEALLTQLDCPDRDVFALLDEFPVLTKQDILAEPDAFLCSDFPRARLSRTITSGTTGMPLTTWLESEALLTSDALWWRRTSWAGHRAGDWIARLVGDPIVPLTDSNPAHPWRVSFPDRRIYLSTYHLSREVAGRMASVLARRRPAFIMGYPSALAALAGYLPDRPFAGWRPRAVLFSSEPMHEHQRRAVAELFDAPIRGLYGCAERVLSAADCGHGAYHLGLVDGYLEGQFGIRAAREPALITGLLNRAMPLIRYALGDDIRPLPDERCTCGRSLPVIAPVVTKHEDSLVTPSGRRITPSILTWAFKDLVGIEASQIVQRSETEVEVLVQADARIVDAVAPALGKRIEDLVFHEMQVTVTRVAAVDVTGAGKSRFVVNDVQPDPR